MIEDKAIKTFIESHMHESWNKMGDTGSDDYIVDEQSYHFGYYRAMEDILSFIENKKVGG